MPKKPRSQLSALQTTYVDAVMTGAPIPAAITNPVMTARSATVQAELARAREEVSNLTTLKRLDVIEIIMDGIHVARTMADAGSMIRGASELCKIFGFYQPEVKNINLNMGQQRLRSKFESFSDEELLAIMQGATIVEGQHTETTQ